MRRNMSASAKVSAGTSRARSSGSLASSIAITTPTLSIASDTAVWAYLLARSCSPAPTACATATLAPSEMPTKRLMSRLAIGVLEPTAAIPSAPPSAEKCPIITVSIRFDSCSKMLVTATGIAKSGIDCQSPPCRISREFCCFCTMHASFTRLFFTEKKDKTYASLPILQYY